MSSKNTGGAPEDPAEVVGHAASSEQSRKVKEAMQEAARPWWAPYPGWYATEDGWAYEPPEDGAA